MSYSTSRDGFKRWDELKHELGLQDRLLAHPDACAHPLDERAGIGSVDSGEQEAEWCGKCGYTIENEDDWIMWGDTGESSL